MHNNIWRVLGLAVCPVILLGALFHAASLVGYAVYSQSSPDMRIIDVAIMASGLCAAFEFVRAVRRLIGKHMMASLEIVK
ncbi:hypothetical protein JCM19237_1974 [Photobacterium aphoticum]|uniref:Uncharacterized protein n=1 Tax=Photobacterium aphoticum TaxID=754436 RepID=A0A090QWT7_9GAMM|nr:hypothetical protein JCM19237_1974 [Photobacterium aphoticum]